jgi:hypothetical protein
LRANPFAESRRETIMIIRGADVTSEDAAAASDRDHLRLRCVVRIGTFASRVACVGAASTVCTMSCVYVSASVSAWRWRSPRPAARRDETIPVCFISAVTLAGP